MAKEKEIENPETPRVEPTPLPPHAAAILEKSYFHYFLRKKFLIQHQIKLLQQEEDLITAELRNFLDRYPRRRGI